MDLKGGWVLFPGRAGGEGHKRRFPSRQGGEEKGAVIYLDKFFPEIQTGSENHWRYLALRFANKTKKSSLMISHSFPAEPPLFAIRSTTSAFPFYNIPKRPPFQSLRKNQYQSKPSRCKASSVIFSAPGEFTRPIPQSPALLK